MPTSAPARILVDDLRMIAGAGDDGAAQTSVIAPPYGWDINDGNTTTSTISIQVGRRRAAQVAIDYFRALLNSQSLDLRNRGARSWSRAPRATRRRAGLARRWRRATGRYAGSMVRYQDQIERPRLARTRRAVEQECQAWCKRRRRSRCARRRKTTQIYRARQIRRPEVLPRFLSGDAAASGDWILHAIHAAITMEFVDPRAGEARLRELIREPPDSNEGHSRLGTLLKRQGRLAESMAVYEDELRRWPWNYRSVDSCMWLITEGTTRPNSAG